MKSLLPITVSLSALLMMTGCGVSPAEADAAAQQALAEHCAKYPPLKPADFELIKGRIPGEYGDLVYSYVSNTDPQHSLEISVSKMGGGRIDAMLIEPAPKKVSP